MHHTGALNSLVTVAAGWGPSIIVLHGSFPIHCMAASLVKPLEAHSKEYWVAARPTLPEQILAVAPQAPQNGFLQAAVKIWQGECHASRLHHLLGGLRICLSTGVPCLSSWCNVTTLAPPFRRKEPPAPLNQLFLSPA